MEWTFRRGIRMRQIRVCRSAAEPLKLNIERYLAKECVGSDRAGQDRSPDPEATTTRVKRQVTREQNQTPRQQRNETGGIARLQFRRTDPLRNNPKGTTTALDNLFQERFRRLETENGENLRKSLKNRWFPVSRRTLSSFPPI